MSVKIHDMTDVWNDISTQYTSIKMDVTDFNSQANSMLIDIKVGGSSKFTVDKNGNIDVAGKQVIGEQKIGWTADIGTAKRTSSNTYAIGTSLTVGNTYSQSEISLIIDRLVLVETALQNATQTIKALKDDTISHGIIGA